MTSSPGALPRRPVRVAFFHVARSNFCGAEKNIFRLLRRLDRTAITPILVLQRENELSERTRAIGIETHILPFPPALDVYEGRLLTWRPDRLWRTWTALGPYDQQVGKLLDRIRPHVVWYSNLRVLLSAWRSGRRTGAKLIWNIWSEPTGWRMRLLHRAAAEIADVINLEYSTQADRLLDWWVRRPRNRRRCVTLYTGVTDFEAFAGTDLRGERGYGAQEMLVLMASNIMPAKGQHDLVEAAIRRRDSWPNVRVVLAGAALDGHADAKRYWEALVQRARSDARPGQIDFLGWRSDIPDVMRSCDIYVSTSYAESMPDAVREAMALGKPVVATNVGGTGEVVADGVSGFLYQPGDVAALAAHLDGFIASAELRRRCGEAGARIIKERFSTPRYARAFEQMVYATLGAAAQQSHER